jgi:hypothetical protein
MRAILHKDLNFNLYKMVVVQELSNHDMANHSMVAEHLFRILSDDLIILMTDEAHFHLFGCGNKENFHYWAEENPQQLHQRPLHSARVTVRCEVANFGVIGLYFFEDIMKCMWNKMSFHVHSFCNNKLKIKITFHCFIYF